MRLSLHRLVLGWKVSAAGCNDDRSAVCLEDGLRIAKLTVCRPHFVVCPQSREKMTDSSACSGYSEPFVLHRV